MAKWKGEKELIKWLKDQEPEVAEKMKRTLNAGGNAIRNKARQTLARTTKGQGKLASSIEVIDFFTDKDFRTEIGPTVEYGAYVEFGTGPKFPPVEPIERWAQLNGMKGAGYAIAKNMSKRDTPAKPYLVPAFNQVAPKVYKELEKQIKGIK